MRKTRLNVQALARREPRLMRALLPPPGFVAASLDLGSGEPVVTAEFSKDRNYTNACFDMVGKAPFYDKENVLQISDIYLMVASISPIGKDQIRAAWDKLWDGKTFAEQWLHDAEVIKTALKKVRQIHKMLVLGIGYSMQPRKMVKSMYENGFELSLENAKKFYDAYWALFPGVRRFSNQLEWRLKQEGFIINPFGYRLTPEPRLGFNYFCQSSVSGIMHVLTAKLFAAAPYARFAALIHDELVIELPEDKVEQFKLDKERAVASLNEDLSWSLKIRCGLVFGRDWYDAK